ncbi:MAG: carbohydrate porin, partial [Bacteroidetes bacterium]|nr:carbohydrate porin [Bacteroidota bacterium]
PELIAEVYYKLFVLKGKITISPDYQFVLNPAYNNDRGPVHVIGLRFHTEW